MQNDGPRRDDILYIKWKQTLPTVLWLETDDSACPVAHPSNLSLAKTWGCITCRTRRTMRQGMPGLASLATYLPFFGMWQASILSQEEELLGDLEIETKNPIRVFSWKTLGILWRQPGKSPKFEVDFQLRLLIIQRLHGVYHRAQGDLFYHWLLPLKWCTQVTTILIAQNQGASVKPCFCTFWVTCTSALIYQWLAFCIAFFQ